MSDTISLLVILFLNILKMIGMCLEKFCRCRRILFIIIIINTLLGALYLFASNNKAQHDAFISKIYSARQSAQAATTHGQNKFKSNATPPPNIGHQLHALGASFLSRISNYFSKGFHRSKAENELKPSKKPQTLKHFHHHPISHHSKQLEGHTPKQQSKYSISRNHKYHHYQHHEQVRHHQSHYTGYHHKPHMRYHHSHYARYQHKPHMRHHHNHHSQQVVNGYATLFVEDSPDSILKPHEEYEIPKHKKIPYRTQRHRNDNVTFSDVAADNPFLKLGGSYKPKHKKPRGKVAIIIPYRRRWYHLRTLLHYIHPILQRQGLEYGIFVINQYGSDLFNKASLMNAGFMEVSKISDYNCFVFHDVDLIPEDYRCMYTCSNNPTQPRHIATGISKYRYRNFPGVTIGGISSFTKQQIKATNGWSNLFHGWGGEDDDMALRIRSRGMRIRRPSTAICRFTSLPHVRDKGNPLNPARFRLLRTTTQRMKYDGLNSIKYKILRITKYATYTNITVEFVSSAMKDVGNTVAQRSSFSKAQKLHKHKN